MTAALRAGASGFSFQTWRPGFYPAGARPADFLSLYAERLPTVEVNGSFYRLPAAATLEKWAGTVPDGFRFAFKVPRTISVFGRVDFVPDLCARVRALGDRLGPLVVRFADGRPRDDAFLAALMDALDDDLQVALDFRDPSWDGIEPELERWGAVRVDQMDATTARFRYLRMRDPPYDDDALRAIAERIRPLLEDGLAVYCYFRHEDAPTAPAYAARLLELVNG
ncbi:MAG TPA: DUF72 domain-containing protein [Solirubrobacteraceae bacterium]|nr:DUF72 domain-containing protein [Solirubrobacteraceae bacterium]